MEMFPDLAVGQTVRRSAVANQNGNKAWLQNLKDAIIVGGAAASGMPEQG